nr:MAG TPA: hypothetical protein [Bacteriophage sp.]
MRNEKELAKLSGLFSSIGMNDHAAEVNEMLADPDDLLEQVAYLHRIRNDAKVAIETTSGDQKAEYERRYKVLTEILEIIYFYA